MPTARELNQSYQHGVERFCAGKDDGNDILREIGNALCIVSDEEINAAQQGFEDARRNSAGCDCDRH